MKDPALNSRIFHFKNDPGYKMQEVLSNLKESLKIKYCIPYPVSYIQKLIPFKNSISGFGNYK